MAEHRPNIVVGVTASQPTDVVVVAATIALQFQADLVCAVVDEGRHPVSVTKDGTVTAMSFNPDEVETFIEQVEPALQSRLADALNPYPVSWSVRALAGGAAHALMQLGEVLDTTMFVVGTRKPHPGSVVHEFFTGSVAVELTHRQHRPVVVVPLSPVPPAENLPWDPT